MTVIMKANRIHVFGGPEVILFEDVPRPTPGTGEVLVRVHAAGVGPWDALVRAGRSALPQPLPLTLGADLAGTVEATASSDSPFSLGDEVFGVTNPRFTGAYAQYALAFTHMLAHKPCRRDFLESAAVPVVAVTARQMLFRDAGVHPGDRVLVQGAAGNVGAYAVQFARAAGAHVIASVLPRDRDEALRLGADEVISIPSEEAQGLRGALDAVIDTVGGKAQRDLFAFVRKGGTLISSVSVPDVQLAQQCGIEAKFILVDVNTKDLEAVADLLDAQQLVVRIGRVLPLGEARQAHEMLERLRPLPAGKVVLNALGDS
ncbi:MAG TPA: NADP-dependent oxidoreductase [Xanthobacteraceae bacterium]